MSGDAVRERGRAKLPRRTDELAHAKGQIDALETDATAARMHGWLVHAEHAIDRVEVRINGLPFGEAEVLAREDIAHVFAGVPHAMQSGIQISGPPLPGGSLRLEIIGKRDGRELIGFEQYWLLEPEAQRSAPEAHLMQRVSGNRDATSFRQVGYTIASQLLAAVRKHYPKRGSLRLLDWGCGSGRATQFMFDIWPGIRLTGCDIDAEAIAWCRQQFPRASFHATAPYPPLPFADRSFDAVVASSVMTHLSAQLQLQWLREIRRILAPGGVFVTSVHGPFAASGLPPHLMQEMQATGIVDSVLDHELDGVAPEGYYRGTFQTLEYTRRRWGEELAVIDYREGGLANHQDLVVLRRRAEGWGLIGGLLNGRRRRS